jgi:ketosteroid isomerase-like protein
MKEYLAFVVVLLVATSCNDQQATNLAAAKKLYEHFNTHDWKKMADLYVDNAEFLDPSIGKSYVKQSQLQIVEKYTGMEQMFPDVQDGIKEMYAVDDKVVIQFIATGNSGDSIKLALPICSILTFKGGKIVRDATYYDN